ncbi:MAG: hypothetical protein U5R31_09800 [Acidimicrobiia bacterium]|nr:hypothetical protein [Acidimicrobiia bacterium]
MSASVVRLDLERHIAIVESEHSLQAVDISPVLPEMVGEDAAVVIPSATWALGSVESVAEQEDRFTTTLYARSGMMGGLVVVDGSPAGTLVDRVITPEGDVSVVVGGSDIDDVAASGDVRKPILPSGVRTIGLQSAVLLRPERPNDPNNHAGRGSCRPLMA